jgi:hypothetical protein
MTISDQSKRTATKLVGAGPYNLVFTFPVFAETDLLVIRQATVTLVETTMVLGVDYTVTLVSGGAGGGTVVLTTGANDDIVTVILNPPLSQETDLPNVSEFPSQSVEDALDKMVNIAKRANDLAERALKLSDGSNALLGGDSRWDADSSRIVNLLAPVDDNDAASKSSVAAQIAQAIITPSVVVSTQGAQLIDDTSFDDMLVTLGAGTKGIAIFKDVTSADVLTELGVDVYTQGLFNNSSAISWRLDLGVLDQDEILDLVPNPNMLVNGDFQIWQNGETFTAATTPANSDDTYIADQWILLSENPDAVDISKTPDPAFVGTQSGMRSTQATINEKHAFLQMLDNPESRSLRGQKVSFSFKGKVNAGIWSFRVSLISWNGGAGVPNSDPISAWNGLGATVSLGPNWSEFGFINSFLITSESVFREEDVTVPADCDHLGVLIVSNDTGMGVGEIRDFSACKLERGSAVTPFESKTRQQELLECQRFFRKTFAENTRPQQNLGVYDGALIGRGADSLGFGVLTIPWRFDPPMRAIPVINQYNPLAANTNAACLTTADERALVQSAGTAGATGIMLGIRSNVAPVNDLQSLEYVVHATADARL